MKITDYLGKPQLFSDVEKTYEKVRKNDRACPFIDVIDMNFIEPPKTLEKQFQKTVIYDTRSIKMIDVFNIILKVATDDIPLLTEWILPLDEDDNDLAKQFIKAHKGFKVPANPRENGKFGVYYYYIDHESYKRDELTDFIEWFRVCEDYHGYIIRKDRIDDFKQYMMKKEPSEEETQRFIDCVVGYFSGIHECDLILFLLK